MKPVIKSFSRRCAVMTAAATVATALIPTLSQAAGEANYPNKPISIIVPFSPGGGTDIVARLLSAELGKKLNANMIVENKPGAGGRIGNDFAAKSAPDGYTLLLGITTLIQQPSLYKSIPYDAFKDFSPLAQLATSVNFLAVPSDSPIHSYSDFLKYVKERKGKINYGSSGNAGTSHLHSSLLNTLESLDMVHVPYKGSAPLLTALLGHEVDYAFVDVASVRPHVLSGKLRVVAVTGPNRSKTFPDVPTFKELGVAGFEPVGWFSLFAPAGVPESIQNLISTTTLEIMRAPETIERLDKLGLTPSQLSRKEFADSMKPDMIKWEKMIKAGDVRVN